MAAQIKICYTQTTNRKGNDMAFILFAWTMIGGVAFANEGGDKCINDHGFRHCIERMVDNGQARFKVNE